MIEVLLIGFAMFASYGLGCYLGYREGVERTERKHRVTAPGVPDDA